MDENEYSIDPKTWEAYKNVSSPTITAPNTTITAPNTGGLGNVWTNDWHQAAAKIMVAASENMQSHAFLVLWYNSQMSRYEKLWADTDEEAVEAAQKVMTYPACGRVEIFELTSRWEKEWKKR